DDLPTKARPLQSPLRGLPAHSRELPPTEIQIIGDMGWGVQVVNGHLAWDTMNNVMAHQWKRDFIVAVAAGASIQIVLFGLVEHFLAHLNPNPTIIPKPFPWLADSQRPLVAIAIPLQRLLRSQLGSSAASWIGFTCGFLALTIAW